MQYLCCEFLVTEFRTLNFWLELEWIKFLINSNKSMDNDISWKHISEKNILWKDWAKNFFFFFASLNFKNVNIKIHRGFNNYYVRNLIHHMKYISLYIKILYRIKTVNVSVFFLKFACTWSILNCNYNPIFISISFHFSLIYHCFKWNKQINKF